MDGFSLGHRVARGQDRLLDRVCDRHAANAAELPGAAKTFDTLIGREYALVVTFRRSGQPIATPMWFALQDGLLYVESLADAGKVRRLQHDPAVRVVPAPSAASERARSPMRWDAYSRRAKSRRRRQRSIAITDCSGVYTWGSARGSE
jgi:PPOX class probable F420-dependent enzyme